MNALAKDTAQATFSVFAKEHGKIFAKYECEIRMLNRLAGAAPSEPSSIAEMVGRQMMRAMGVSRDEIDRAEWRRRIRLFMAETDAVENIEDVTDEDLDRLASEKTTSGVNVFRRDENGLYFPCHALKAGLKEAVSVLYPYASTKFGVTRKGGTSFVAERVFVRPSHISVLRDDAVLQEADGIATLQGLVIGPRGPRPIVTQHEYVEHAVLRFQIEVLKGEGKSNEELSGKWPAIFSYMEENGIGAHRKTTDYARFMTTRFDAVK